MAEMMLEREKMRGMFKEPAKVVDLARFPEHSAQKRRPRGAGIRKGQTERESWFAESRRSGTAGNSGSLNVSDLCVALLQAACNSKRGNTACTCRAAELLFFDGRDN